MTRPRRLAVLVLFLALIAPWGASAEPKSEPGAAQALAGLWGWLTRLWAEAGCSLDPNGCTSSTVSQGDAVSLATGMPPPESGFSQS